MGKNSASAFTSGVDEAARKVGVYVAYDEDGEEIWRKDDFAIGFDKVSLGTSIGMRAMRIVDPSTGEEVKSWNPWGII